MRGKEKNGGRVFGSFSSGKGQYVMTRTRFYVQRGTHTHTNLSCANIVMMYFSNRERCVCLSFFLFLFPFVCLFCVVGFLHVLGVAFLLCFCRGFVLRCACGESFFIPFFPCFFSSGFPVCFPFFVSDCLLFFAILVFCVFFFFRFSFFSLWRV